MEKTFQKYRTAIAQRRWLLLLLLFTFLIGNNAFAQAPAFSLRGVLVDTASNEPVSNATVSLVSVQDSTVRFHTLSTEKGSFELKELSVGSYNLSISYQSHATINKQVTITGEQPATDLGVIKMTRVYNYMPEVVIKDNIPVKVKGDTINYKTDAFKTKPDASVEDLLKKLPGVQVDRSGTVKAQGEQVQKVYVDGKEFFSNDPKLATKGLTADMIEQVQVFNDVSEQARFSGIDEGTRTRVINLKLKKDKKSGVLGTAYAGLGTNNRYNAGVSANYFKGATQLSLLANSNNINIAGGAATGAASAGSRTGWGAAGSVSGLNKSSSVGLNYHDLVGKNVDVTTSYRFLQMRNINSRTALRQTFLSDSTVLTDRQSNDTAQNTTQRLNIKVIYTIDSMNAILYTPSITIQQSRSGYNDLAIDQVAKKGLAYTLAENSNSTDSKGNPVNWVNNLLWRRKFQTRGRTFSVNLLQSNNRNDLDVYSAIDANFYNPGGSLSRKRNTNYFIRNNNITGNNSITLSYTEPVAPNKIVEVNYSYNTTTSRANRKVFHYDTLLKEFTIPEDTLTNDFRQANQWHRIGSNFKGVARNYSYQVGMAVQQMMFTTTDLSKNLDLSRRFFNIIPTASVTFRPATNKSLQVNYRGRSNQPDIRQLQNVTDVTSYPYIRKGNPSLRQEFVHNLMLTYNTFDPSSLQSLFVFITYNSTHNKISSALQQHAGEQIWMPINLDGAYNISGTVSLGLPVKRWEGTSFNTSTQVDFNRNVTMVNDVMNYTKDFSVGQDLSVNYNAGTNLDLGLNININYNAVRYTLQDVPNTAYFTHYYALDGTYSFPKDLIFSTNFDYTAYSGRTDGFNQNYFLWNASISKKLLRNKRGELRFSVNDILDQNISTARYKGDNYLEDMRNLTLRRFAMLTFVYKINHTGSKGG